MGGALHGLVRQRQDPRLGRAVGPQYRIKEVGRIVVLGEIAIVARQALPRQRRLVHVIAAVRIGVQLLEQHEVRVQIVQHPEGVVQVVIDGLLRTGATLGAAVHEEAEVVAVGPEAQVPGGDGIGPLQLRRLPRHGRLIVHVRQAVIGDEYVGDIAAHHHDHRGQRDGEDFQDFLEHGTSSLRLSRSSAASCARRPSPPPAGPSSPAPSSRR